MSENTNHPRLELVGYIFEGIAKGLMGDENGRRSQWFVRSPCDGKLNGIEGVAVYKLATATDPGPRAELAEAIHYPGCWDTAAYPTLEHALLEWKDDLLCSDCNPIQASEAACYALEAIWQIVPDVKCREEPTVLMTAEQCERLLRHFGWRPACEQRNIKEKDVTP